MSRNRRFRVGFVTVLVPDYKVWLYKALAQRPEFEFHAVHGPEKRGSAPADAGQIGLAHEIIAGHRFLTIGAVELTWIPAVLWLLRTKLDVLILQDGVRIVSNWLMHLLSRLLKIRVLYYSHGFNHQGTAWRPGWLHRTTERLRRFALRHSDGVLVYSAGGKEYLRSKRVTVPISVVGSMIDGSSAIRRAERVAPARIAELRLRHGLGDDGILVVGLGRLVKEKRHDVFVDTISLLERIVDGPVVGLIAGEGPLRPALEEMVEGKPVRLLGHVVGDDLSLLLASADFVLLPGMVGLAIVEAFCAGAPFIALDRDDHSPEIMYLRDGQTGLLLRDDDPTGLAQQLSDVLTDRKRLAWIGNNAKEYAHQHFDGESVVNAFVDAINGTMGSDSTFTPPSPM